MVEIKCQECGEALGSLAADELERKIAAGEVVKGVRFERVEDHKGDIVDRQRDGYWGLCRECKHKDRVIADQAGSERAADAQMIRIRERVALIRERRKDLTLEQAVRAAVEDEYDPTHEPDRGFRAYLLGEGAPKDDATDAKAREFFADLSGPTVGGAV